MGFEAHEDELKNWLMGDVSDVPASGVEAMKIECQSLLFNTAEDYWIDLIRKDITLTSKNPFYLSLLLQAHADDRSVLINRNGADIQKVIDTYYANEKSFSHAQAAQLAWSIKRSPRYSGPAFSNYEAICAFQTNLYEHAVAFLGDKNLIASNQVEIAYHLIEHWKLADDEAFLEYVLKDKDKIDPWIVEVISGTVAYKQAWNARGSGYANTVTRTGARKFSDLIAQCERHFVKAAELRPDIGTSFVKLISIECPSAPIKTQRTWMANGLKVNPDSRNLVKRWLFSFTPRWGGSVDEMESELDRYLKADADPKSLIPALRVITRLSGIAEREYDKDYPDSRADFFIKRGFADETLKILRVYADDESLLANQPPIRRDVFLSEFAQAAFWSGDMDLALTFLRRITHSVLERRFLKKNAPFSFTGQNSKLSRWLPILARASNEDAKKYRTFFAAIDAEDIDKAKELVDERTAEDYIELAYKKIAEGKPFVQIPDACIRNERTPIIRPDFAGSIGFELKLDGKAKSGTLELSLMRREFLSYGQYTPQLEIFRYYNDPTNVWWVSVKNSSGIKGDIGKTLVPKRKICHNDAEPFHVWIECEDGKLQFVLDGTRLLPKPMTFVHDNYNRWYSLVMKHQFLNVSKMMLSNKALAFAEPPEVEHIELPKFVSQLPTIPLPTVDYVTNINVRTAFDRGDSIFPEYIHDGCATGPWWGTDFEKEEAFEFRDAVLADLKASLTNEVWDAMPRRMQSVLALRYAAAAFRAKEYMLMSVFVDKFVDRDLLVDGEVLSVPDSRYDDSEKPGSNARYILCEIYYAASAIGATWYYAKDNPGVVYDVSRVKDERVVVIPKNSRMEQSDEWQLVVTQPVAKGFMVQVSIDDTEYHLMSGGFNGEYFTQLYGPVVLKDGSHAFGTMMDTRKKWNPKGETVEMTLTRKDGAFTWLIDGEIAFQRECKSAILARRIAPNAIKITLENLAKPVNDDK